MPNAAARRSRKAATQVAETNNTQNGVTVTATLSAGDFVVEELGEDYQFTRQGAGRKRTPTPFDDLVNEWAGAGTKRIPVEDETQGNEVIKLLAKACDYRSRGLDKRIEDMDGQKYVVFKINAEKAKRERKPRDESDSENVVTDADRLEMAETE